MPVLCPSCVPLVSLFCPSCDPLFHRPGCVLRPPLLTMTKEGPPTCTETMNTYDSTTHLMRSLGDAAAYLQRFVLPTAPIVIWGVRLLLLGGTVFCSFNTGRGGSPPLHFTPPHGCPPPTYSVDHFVFRSFLRSHIFSDIISLHLFCLP